MCVTNIYISIIALVGPHNISFRRGLYNVKQCEMLHTIIVLRYYEFKFISLFPMRLLHSA